jgi:SAM-dependent methyltransferase
MRRIVPIETRSARAPVTPIDSIAALSQSERVTGDAAKLEGWLATPLGRRCIATEQRVVRRALECVFGEQLLQIGSWGHPRAFLRHARTQHAALIELVESRHGKTADARELRLHGAVRPDDFGGAAVVSDPVELAIASDSVDAVLLPHTLELTASPHALLREVDRVLRADGQLIVLSFVPIGLWGLRFLLARDGYPQGHRRMIRERRLRDWLELLSFEVGGATRYCHTLPFERLRRTGTLPKEEWAQRWLPMLAGGSMLAAHKRVRPLTPMKPVWRRERLRAVGGLVKPTTRAGASETRQRG